MSLATTFLSEYDICRSIDCLIYYMQVVHTLNNCTWKVWITCSQNRHKTKMHSILFSIKPHTLHNERHVLPFFVLVPNKLWILTQAIFQGLKDLLKGKSTLQFFHAVICVNIYSTHSILISYGLYQKYLKYILKIHYNTLHMKVFQFLKNTICYFY